MEENKSIYVVVSRTQTKVGKLLRMFGGLKYNHASISLDKDLKQLYAFARPYYHAPFMGKLVKETATSYVLNNNKIVPIVVYKIPVTHNQYRTIRQIITNMVDDPECVYNYLSIISRTINMGLDIVNDLELIKQDLEFNKWLEIDNAYTCIDFVMVILEKLGFTLTKPTYKYTPDDLTTMLCDYKVYEGDIRGIMQITNIDDKFFEDLPIEVKIKSLSSFYKLYKREKSIKK